MKNPSRKLINYFIAGVAVILLIVAGYWFAQTSQQAPFEPGKTIEATSVVLDGNAGE